MKPKISNIIFDLGGVILDIDYQLTEQAFKSIGFEEFDKLYTQFKQSELFDDFETGRIKDGEFISKISAFTDKNISEKEVVRAWNAMLLKIPRHNLEILEQLKQHYRLFLLSNTNAIHFKAFFDYVQQAFGMERFSNIFEKEYYSHMIGKRKPNSEVFRFVMNENNLYPEETLFVDDTLQHVEGAGVTGLHVFHKKPGTSWEQLIRAYDLMTG